GEGIAEEADAVHAAVTRDGLVGVGDAGGLAGDAAGRADGGEGEDLHSAAQRQELRSRLLCRPEGADRFLAGGAGGGLGAAPPAPSPAPLSPPPGSARRASHPLTRAPPFPWFAAGVSTRKAASSSLSRCASSARRGTPSTTSATCSGRRHEEQSASVVRSRVS